MCWGIRMLKIGDMVKFKNSYYYSNYDYGKVAYIHSNGIGIVYKIKSETNYRYFWRFEYDMELLKIATICA